MKSRYLVIGLGLIAWSCSENPGGPVEEIIPVIESVSLDELWSINTTEKKIVEIKITDPQGPGDLHSVFLQIYNQEGSIVFSDSLYDDGGLNESGDIIAADGVFRNRFLPSAITIESGNYTFEFDVKDKEGNSPGKYEKDVSFVLENIPEIKNITAIDTLKSASASKIISAIVIDASNTGTLTVYMDLLQGNHSVVLQPYRMQKQGNDSVYTYTIDSSFAAGRLGSFKLRFYAETEGGLSSEMIDKDLFIENVAGRFVEYSIPSSIQRPVQDNYFALSLFTVKVYEPQGLNDIEAVYFNFKKPDGSPAFNNPFFMVDNGLPFNIDNVFVEAGDEVENDGIFSITFLVDNQNQLGTYQFEFIMIDRAGNYAEKIEDTIEVVE
jgi:hypothetical protein